ncbi:lysophospholipid acyltransferase family protein [Corynebacterium heidelbergense]|nr:lysophospholipid acyltransferase family protein [Corynebacterium heidelbergense]
MFDKHFHVPDSFEEPAKHPESRELFYGRIIIPSAKAWMALVQRLQVHVYHPERIPVNGGGVIAVNHTGYWDFVYGGIPAFAQGGRLVRFMAKKEIFDVRGVGAVMRAMKHIPVDRAAGAESTAEAIRRVRKGQLVGIFPEATISRSFEIKEVKQGAAKIAYEGSVPLIPLAIWGSQRVWTKGRKPVWRPRGVNLVMAVGEPVEVSANSAETTERLHAAMQKTLKDVQERFVGLYGEMPKGEFWVPASMGGSAPTLEAATVEDREAQEKRKRDRAEAARRAAELQVQRDAADRAERENAKGPIARLTLPLRQWFRARRAR